MANITEEHLHHMARRHHAAMKKYEDLKEKHASKRERYLSTFETLAGFWTGGAFEGRTAGASIGPLPVNLGGGLALLAVSHLDYAGKWGTDLHNVGNGLVGSWAAATGYAFGKRWKDTKHPFGGGGHPWRQPYEEGWSAPAAPPAP